MKLLGTVVVLAVVVASYIFVPQVQAVASPYVQPVLDAGMEFKDAVMGAGENNSSAVQDSKS